VNYLVDANVLSEPTKTLPNAKVVAWLRNNGREIAVDPIILAELRFAFSCCATEGGGPASSAGSTRVLAGFAACRGRPRQG
jgi:hypothetical protein